MDALIVTIGFLLGALLFGAATVYGLKTGKMWAYSDFARRDTDPDWFWGWAIINGAAAALSAVGFLLMLAVRLFGSP
jgi:hypothetical protein